MSQGPEKQYRPLLEAVSFAARAHRHQLRKDGQTPYASHVFRVCLVVRHVFQIDDAATLLAATLHDTIEDTTTDYDDLVERFGSEIASWVALLSKDKRLPEDQRESAYIAGLVTAPWQVQACKLADIFDNLLDSVHSRPDQRAKSRQRARQVLEALHPALPQQLLRPWETVAALLAELDGNA
jgi:guanosine-3',5'-bis(diphosphate) 3'-pyrophosphohydrolase